MHQVATVGAVSWPTVLLRTCRPRERWVPSQVTCCTSGLCPSLLHYFPLFGQRARAPQAECHPKRVRAMACRAVAHQAFGTCFGALRLDGSPTKIYRCSFVIVLSTAVLGGSLRATGWGAYDCGLRAPSCGHTKHVWGACSPRLVTITDEVRFHLRPQTS